MNKNQSKTNPSKITYFDNSTNEAKTERANFSPKKTATQISVSYLLIGALWVALSDKLVLRFIANEQLLLLVGMIKGWLYILATSVMIYLLINASLSKIQTINFKLLKKYNQLASSEQKLQKQLELLTENEEKRQLISHSTNDGIWNYEKGKKTFSERWFEITGYTKENMDQLESWKSLVHPDDIEAVLPAFAQGKTQQNSTYRCKFRLLCKNGNYIWVLSSSRLVFNQEGKLIRGAGSHTDISDLKRYEQQLEQLAYEDYLTKLPNRTAFYETTKFHLQNCSNGKKALLFLDIDNFKYINDTLGHMNGDQLIVEIGERLSSLLDQDKSLYRIGGDEFILFLHQYEDISDIASFADQLLQSFDTAFTISECTLNITVSIGIAQYPTHGKDVDTLLKCADMAMYKAKSNYHGTYTFYNKEMDKKVTERMVLENELRKALKLQEFSLYFQPQMDTTSGKVTSMETLLRWNNKKLGMVSPEKFISIAEENNLINSIGDWVLLNACLFLNTLHKQGYPDITLSVNVSIVQLMQQNFTYNFMQTLAQTGIESKYIVLEITESVFVESYDGIKDKLMELKAKGIKISLDDFGKGYSNLSHLANIPINELKIDKVFIDSIEDPYDDMSLASMIIMLGRKLGLSLVAEGVETETQLIYLKKHCCHKIQGYFFCKPMPQEDVISFLNRNAALPHSYNECKVVASKWE